MFCCTLLFVHSSIAINLMGKRERVALLNLSSRCLMMVERLFLAVPQGCLLFVIVVFPDHTHLLFLQNAPRGAFCNAFDLHSAIICHKYLCFVYFEWSFYTGFTVYFTCWLTRLFAGKSEQICTRWNKIRTISRMLQMYVRHHLKMCLFF